MSYEPTQPVGEEYWLEKWLEEVRKVKYELRSVLQGGRIKDKRLQKLLLKALEIVHMYEVELEDRLDELSTTVG
jgi:acyl carrier protein phosphodiesterase